MRKYIFFIWFCVLAVVTGFLVAEYTSFKQSAQELEQLKQDYRVYREALKKLIITRETSYATLEPAVNHSKKKRMPRQHQASEGPFLAVNREADYLKKAALLFAQEQNVDAPLKKMYETDTSEIIPQKQSKKSPHKRVFKPGFKTGLLQKRVPPTRVAHPRVPKKRFSFDASVRKFQREPLFMCPIDKKQFWLSSGFGPRENPDGSWGFHNGIDMAAARGTLVKAGGAGKVVQAGCASGYGNTIVIVHNTRFKTRYAHLDKILVKLNQQVEQGEIIGKVGATGFVRKSKNPYHLHFEVYVLGKHVNPFYFLV